MFGRLAPQNGDPYLSAPKDRTLTMNRLLLSASVAAIMPCMAQAQTPPTAAFARLPAVSEASISPNGQNIAILGGGAVERSITFNVIDQPGIKAIKLGDVETVGLSWAGDEYAVAKVAVYDKVGPRADYRLLRNAVVSKDGKFLSFLLQGDQLSSQITDHAVLGVAKGPAPKVMVMGLSLASGPSAGMDTRMARKGDDGDMRVRAIFAADPVTGKGVQVERGDFDTLTWQVDLTGQARVLYKRDDVSGRRKLFARSKGDKNWKLIQDGDDGREFHGYSDVDDAIYFSKQTDAGVQLHRLRIATGAVETVGKPLTAGEFDLLWDNHTDAVVGARALGEQSSIEWLDPAFGTVYGTLSRAFKGKTVTLRSWSEDKTRFLATVEGPDTPTAWYLYDRPRKEISPVGAEYPELAEAKLGTTTAFRYKARDGLDIPAYLTLPPGLPAGTKAPLVVMPHGGPNARDDDGFDYMVQFLASRGYAVLRPQFRGSTGFGPAFEKAGKGEWGGKIQTDILDGVAALASHASVDAGRACIVGASFGGFSALSGAVFSPKTYRCAASIAGVADLGLLIDESGTDFGRENRSFERLKDEVRASAPEGLSKVSPLRNAGQAGAPILLLHGAEDTVVGPLHSRQMAAALQKAGKPVEYVEIPGENHYLRKTASRTVVLEKLEAFLGKHLGPAATSADR